MSRFETGGQYESSRHGPLIIGDKLSASGFIRSYAPNTWDEFPDRVVEPLIGIQDVLDLQSLVMRLKDQHRRSILKGEHRHGFAALNAVHASADELYDGSLEEYLVARVAKESYDQWSMRVRFRQNEMTEETKTMSHFDDYSFSWLKNSNLQAWYGEYTVAVSDDIGTHQDWLKTEPLTPEMLDALRGRLQDHMTMVVATDALRNVRRQTSKD